MIKKKLRIFGKDFVKNNKKNFSLIINRKKKELKEFLELNNIEKELKGTFA